VNLTDSDAATEATAAHFDQWSQIARLLEAQLTLDRAVRDAFTSQSESRGVALVQTRAFWRLLDRSAARISTND
jgi:hypothetical protein